MGVRNINPKEDALVVRSNKLIEAHYETTLHQMRIMLWLLSEIKPEDRDFQTYRVSIKELAKFVGLEGNKNIYQQLADATRGMVGSVVEIGSLEDDRFLQTGLISSAEYRIGDGHIDLSVDPKLKPYLLELRENFTTAYLRDLMQMKSVYSIRLYDLLNQYRKIGKRRLKVKELKKMLGIEKKYKLYGHFKTRVIKPAVTEINERTDLFVDYHEHKESRSVVALNFAIKVKDSFQTVEAGGGEFTDPELAAQLVAHGFKEPEANELVAIYGETDRERITYHLAELERGIESGKIKRAVPWLRKAIEEDYRDQKSLFQQQREEARKEANERARERKRRAEEAAAIREQMNELEAEYLQYRLAFVGDTIGALSDNERADWEDEFKASLPAHMLRFWNKEPRFDRRIFLTNAENFIADKTGEISLEFEAWLVANEKPDYQELARKRDALL